MFYLEFFVRVPDDFSSTEDGPKDNPDITRSVTQVALPATKRLVAMTPWTWKVLTWSQRQNLISKTSKPLFTELVHNIKQAVTRSINFRI